MKSGATSIELEATWEFSDDGSDCDLLTIRVGNRIMPRGLANRLMDWLGAREQQRLVDEAWANADSEADDTAADEAREAS